MNKRGRDLFDDLKARGVKAIGLWISDGNKAMLNAIAAKFQAAPRQRCVMHKMDNVLSYIPTKQQDQVKPELRALFYQRDRPAADQAVAADHSSNTSRSILQLLSAYSAIWRPV